MLKERDILGLNRVFWFLAGFIVQNTECIQWRSMTREITRYTEIIACFIFNIRQRLSIEEELKRLDETVERSVAVLDKRLNMYLSWAPSNLVDLIKCGKTNNY